MKTLLIVIFIIFPFIVLSNSDLLKINSLFEKGILDEKSFLKSIEGQGVDTSSNEFLDVFELYKNGSIGFDTFNRAVLNLNQSLLKVSNKSNVRFFKFGKCSGSNLLCDELFKLPEEDLITEIQVDTFNTCEQAINTFKDQEDLFDNATEKQGWREMSRKVFIKNDNFSIVINFLYFIPQYGRNVDVKMYIKGDLGTEQNNCKDFVLYNLGIDVIGKNIGTVDLEEVF